MLKEKILAVSIIGAYLTVVAMGFLIIAIFDKEDKKIKELEDEIVILTTKSAGSDWDLYRMFLNDDDLWIKMINMAHIPYCERNGKSVDYRDVTVSRLVFTADAIQINFGEQKKNIFMVVWKNGTREYFSLNMLSGTLTAEEFCKLVGGS